jgi:hypothetical protein
VSALLPRMLQANCRLWAKDAAYLYADSGSSAGKYLAAIKEHFAHWSVSYNKWTSGLERGAEELPEASWSAPETLRRRDGQDHQAQYNFLRYQPEGCDRPQLFAVRRHRLAAGEMFWRHEFVTCEEKPDGALAKRVFERHALKGDKERAFSELLSDLDLHHPPCQSLSANNAFYLLAALAYNFLQGLKVLHLPASEQPKRVRTLVRSLLLIPVQMKRHARKLKACFFAPAGWTRWWQELLSRLLPNLRLVAARADTG